MLSIPFQYVTDSQGNQVAVQISVQDWDLLQKQVTDLHRKLEILQGIREAVLEVWEARQSEKKLQTLNDFLDEC